jgi:hypothetical protein
LTFGVLAAVAASSSSTSNIEPGVLAFLIVAAMGVALVFLLRSMNKQFRKITPDPAAPDPAAPDAGQGEELKTGTEAPR